MDQVGYFEAISEAHFRTAMNEVLNAVEPSLTADGAQDIIKDTYHNIHLPQRTQFWSAWYDFVAPIRFELRPEENLIIPTGVGVRLNPGWWIDLLPHHMCDPQHRWLLTHTISLDDDSYMPGKTDGHVIIEVINMSRETTILVPRGQTFARGMFLPYGTGRMKS